MIMIIFKTDLRSKQSYFSYSEKTSGTRLRNVSFKKQLTREKTKFHWSQNVEWQKLNISTQTLGENRWQRPSWEKQLFLISTRKKQSLSSLFFYNLIIFVLYCVFLRLDDREFFMLRNFVLRKTVKRRKLNFGVCSWEKISEITVNIRKYKLSSKI